MEISRERYAELFGPTTGDRIVRGLNDLVNGALDDPAVKAKALEQLQILGFGDGE